jgi:hypothetical protein
MRTARIGAAGLWCAGWLLCAAAATPPTVANAATALPLLLQSLDDCTARLDRSIDIGFERIAARCPALIQALQTSALAGWLPRSWRDAGNDLSAGSLEELRVVLTRELALHSDRPRPSVQRLREVFRDMGQSAQGRSGLWSRIRNWLRTLIAREPDADDAGWLARLVSRIGLPQTLIEIITYASLAVLVALAVAIVGNELRAAGLLQRGARRRIASGVSSFGSQPLSWRDVERAESLERPRLLLELIILRLGLAHRLSGGRSLATRELLGAAQLPEPEDAGRLSQLALTAERVRYSSASASATELDAAVTGGRTLLDHLTAGSGNSAAMGEAP